ncbi:MAG: (2Fe-2S)-binding protein [Solirubrobacteraceae bacterium]
MSKHLIRFVLNGEPRELAVAPNELLMNVIRETEQLTGTKYGCGIGECGACAVHVDGQPLLSCLMLAVEVDGREVTTVEGIARDGRLDPVQEAFLDEGGVQCGYCTPGMVIMSRALLDENPRPTELEVRHYLRGSLCRCTGYHGIVRAVLSAADKETQKVA